MLNRQFRPFDRFQGLRSWSRLVARTQTEVEVTSSLGIDVGTWKELLSVASQSLWAELELVSVDAQVPRGSLLDKVGGCGRRATRFITNLVSWMVLTAFLVLKAVWSFGQSRNFFHDDAINIITRTFEAGRTWWKFERVGKSWRRGSRRAVLLWWCFLHLCWNNVVLYDVYTDPLVHGSLRILITGRMKCFLNYVGWIFSIFQSSWLPVFGSSLLYRAGCVNFELVTSRFCWHCVKKYTVCWNIFLRATGWKLRSKIRNRDGQTVQLSSHRN